MYIVYMYDMYMYTVYVRIHAKAVEHKQKGFFTLVCTHIHVLYNPRSSSHSATLPGMWERTVTIGSAGKTFHATGWKVCADIL